MPTQVEYRQTSDIPLEMSTLKDDNRSAEARQGIQEFYDAQEAGCIAIVAGCGDSRRKGVKTYNTNRIIEMRAIAAAVNGNPSLEFLLNHPGVTAVMSGQHFDGESLRDPHVLEHGLGGCGGLHTKAARERTGEIRAVKGVYRFVDVEIQSSNIFTQAMAAAASLAAYTDNPVVAYVEDHRSLRVYPIALLTDRGRNVTSEIPLGRLGDWRYVLKNGEIPELDANQLPESIQGLLEANREVVAAVTPEFYASQQVQDPKLVVLTTAVVPVGTRYPALMREPNKSFDLFMQYDKEGKEVIGINEESLRRVFEQAEYPIYHSAHAKPGESFHSTSTVLIETPSMALSENVATRLVNEPWMMEWLQSGHRRVWLAETEHGETKEKVVELLRT